jgi:cation diffusion facilitator family transporter
MKVFEQHTREIRRVTWVGLVLNAFLAAAKIMIGLLFASQALIADGIHSISDMATDLVVIIGAGYWTLPPDQKHPYGHGRVESLVSIIIGVVLIAAAFGMIWEAVRGFDKPHTQLPGWPALAVALISIGLKEWLYRWTIGIGRKLHSSALVSNAWHHRSDALSSVPVAVAVIGGFIFPDLRFLDHLAAVIVSAMLLKASWDIAAPCVRELCETGAGKEFENIIRQAATEVNAIAEIHAIRTRKIGGSVFADMHILVPPEMTVRKGHEISGILRRRIMETDERIVDVLIHIEPNDKAEV